MEYEKIDRKDLQKIQEYLQKIEVFKRKFIESLNNNKIGEAVSFLNIKSGFCVEIEKSIKKYEKTNADIEIKTVKNNFDEGSTSEDVVREDEEDRG